MRKLVVPSRRGQARVKGESGRSQVSVSSPSQCVSESAEARVSSSTTTTTTRLFSGGKPAAVGHPGWLWQLCLLAVILAHASPGSEGSGRWTGSSSGDQPGSPPS